MADKMTQGEFLERIAEALYGKPRRPGWMSRLAADLKISTGHLNNLHKGHRKMGEQIVLDIRGLLVRGSLEAIARHNQLTMMLEEINDPYYLDLALKAEPDPDPENDNGPAPTIGG